MTQGLCQNADFWQSLCTSDAVADSPGTVAGFVRQGGRKIPCRWQDANGICSDLKSVSYFSSQLPLLKDTRWDADKQYKVASNVKPQQAAEHIGKVLGSVAFKLPYSQELEEQYLAGTLLSDLAMKDSRSYRKELDRILKEVFGC